jgi:3-keto-disaccharide hydrolase
MVHLKEAPMRRILIFGIMLATIGLVTAVAQTKPSEWVTLFDGTNLDQFTRVGNANWTLANGVVEATSGPGFLVTKETYDNFEIRVEFWVDDNGNSGVYMRCQDAAKIADTTCYEANVFDKRPDQSGRTGAIVHVAKPLAIVDAANKWNTFEIVAKGPQLTVRLNGTLTAQAEDQKFAKGPIALQYAAGTVRFRRVQIRRL